MSEDILLGDVITTRKPHPCGSSEWTVIRTGADIKIRCSGCGRIVMLDRDSFLRRRKAVVSRGSVPPDPCQYIRIYGILFVDVSSVSGLIY